jgi:hypothetical protein
MIIGIHLPQESRIEQTEDGNLLIIFDQSPDANGRKWVERMAVTIKEGNSAEDYKTSPVIDRGLLTVANELFFDPICTPFDLENKRKSSSSFDVPTTI